ncbi:zinc-dependent alcohol dehydrogenase [Microbacterium sp. CPCC 204701]|uniref:zinc-dependent alcohol dehydrogenase n=1 Tax=Microbacterium sp. CPCC 204701 TaxID=2493084 RepID=UPI000FDB15E1|nr:alcohol dehydrogenase catalytic domain-containing protein [Microbacterium sp. CPCC 204701]
MKAFVINGPGDAAIADVEPPEARPDEVVVRVARVGICGTDAEFLRGTQPYLASGGASYPLRIGHEWCGTVARIGADVDPSWIGRRVTGDTMLGCRECGTCKQGRQHLCPRRTEIGVLGGRPGALAEELAVPVTALHSLPGRLSDTLGALVEPASLALRAVNALPAVPGDRLLVWGTGALGLSAVLFAAVKGLEVTAAARSPRAFELARKLGATHTCTEEELPNSDSFDSAIAASPDASVPERAARKLRDGGTLALLGISGETSNLDVRDIVTRDLHVVGLLSGSPCFRETIQLLSQENCRRLELIVGTEVDLDEATSAFDAAAKQGPQRGPKTHILITTHHH